MTAVPWIIPPADRKVDRRSRTLPCACGATIRADRVEPTFGVVTHQRTVLHRAWRERHGL